MSKAPAPTAWPRDEQVVAWLRAWLRGQRSGDSRLVELATAELRALGVEVRAVPGEMP